MSKDRCMIQIKLIHNFKLTCYFLFMLHLREKIGDIHT